MLILEKFFLDLRIYSWQLHWVSVCQFSPAVISAVTTLLPPQPSDADYTSMLCGPHQSKCLDLMSTDNFSSSHQSSLQPFDNSNTNRRSACRNNNYNQFESLLRRATLQTHSMVSGKSSSHRQLSAVRDRSAAVSDRCVLCQSHCHRQLSAVIPVTNSWLQSETGLFSSISLLL